MKKYTHIERLLEKDHCYGNNPDNPMPQELLDMKIGDLLDKVSSFDSEGDAEYEALLSILDAVSTRVSSGSHEGDSILNVDNTETVEVGDDEISPDDPNSSLISTPTWSQGENNEDDLDSFEFQYEK